MRQVESDARDALLVLVRVGTTTLVGTAVVGSSLGVHNRRRHRCRLIKVDKLDNLTLRHSSAVIIKWMGIALRMGNGWEFLRFVGPEITAKSCGNENFFYAAIGR